MAAVTFLFTGAVAASSCGKAGAGDRASVAVALGHVVRGQACYCY